MARARAPLPALPPDSYTIEGHGPARASHAALSVVAKLAALACATLLLVSAVGAAMPLVLRHFIYGTACGERPSRVVCMVGRTPILLVPSKEDRQTPRQLTFSTAAPARRFCVIACHFAASLCHVRVS